jgi:hypothetical protein
MENESAVQLMEGDQRQELLSHAASTIDETEELKLPTIRHRGWVAVPFEFVPLLNRQLAQVLCRTASSGGTQLYAVKVPILADTACYRLGTDAGQIEKWRVRESWTSWLIFPGNFMFDLLATMENYNVLASTETTIQEILGMTSGEAFVQFQLAEGRAEYRPDKELFREIYDYYVKGRSLT